MFLGVAETIVGSLVCYCGVGIVQCRSVPGREGGRGTPLYIYICAAASGRVFAQFWSENAYRLYPFWSGIGYGFRWNDESV